VAVTLLGPLCGAGSLDGSAFYRNDLVQEKAEAGLRISQGGGVTFQSADHQRSFEGRDDGVRHAPQVDVPANLSCLKSLLDDAAALAPILDSAQREGNGERGCYRPRRWPCSSGGNLRRPGMASRRTSDCAAQLLGAGGDLIQVFGSYLGALRESKLEGLCREFLFTGEVPMVQAGSGHEVLPRTAANPCWLKMGVAFSMVRCLVASPFRTAHLQTE